MALSPLHIVHTVSSLRSGGMENFVLRLASAQKRDGHEAAVIVLQDGPLLEQAEAAGLVVYTLGGKSRMERIVWTVAIMARLRPQIVHAHNPTSMHYAAIGKVVARAKLVVTDHAQTRGIIRTPSDIEWRLTDAVVAVSKDTRARSAALALGRQVHVFHNGIDIRPAKRSRAEVRAELELGSDELVATNVAAFVPVKAHDVLLRALARLKASQVRLTLLLVGDGIERENMERLARELGLGREDVRFLGFRSDVADLLNASDVFVLPSRAEGLPLALLEGMAHRLPVVATPVGGVPELLSDGEQGLLVRVDDEGALASALRRLAEDAPLRLRLGAGGNARVVSEFSFERMTHRYENLYRSLV